MKIPPAYLAKQRPKMWWIPALGAVTTIGLQILWPLASGQLRVLLTIVTVIAFAGTSVTHAWIYFGPRWALRYLGITFTFAFVVEAVGTGTGFPFSAYEYTDALGVRVLSVPLIVPLAWAMTAYPALLLSRRITNALPSPHAVRVTCAAIGAVAMTSWDLFLDPQMTSAGFWNWAPGAQALPGVPGIPAVNYLGWLVTSFVLMLLLSYLPIRAVFEGVPATSEAVPATSEVVPATSEVVPATLWTWTWIGGIISNAFFFGRPTVAAVGGLAMAIVTIPYLWLLLTGRGTNPREPATTDRNQVIA